MKESPLADLIPLWRTLREEGTTVLVTPALDYVGGLEVFPGDPRFQKDDERGALGESLRSLVGSLEDGTTLLFLTRVSAECPADVEAYRAAKVTGPDADRSLRRYVESRAEWLASQRLRSRRTFLFFSPPGASKNGLARGHLGLRLLFANTAELTADEHARRVALVARLRDRLKARLAELGVASRELSPRDMAGVHHALLNPEQAAQGVPPPDLRLRDDLWNEKTVRRVGSHLREYSEAESLTVTDLVEDAGWLRQGRVLRRVCTLRTLPESGTGYFASDPLVDIAVPGPDGDPTPFPYWLSVALHVEDQGRARFVLNAQHGLVDALRTAVPFLADRSIGREAADRAKQGSIAALFEELHEMSSKVVSLSVSVLLEGRTEAELDARTEAARAAFAAAGNSQLYAEEVAQLPAFLSMLPGAGRYQLRKKGCTSRNAADFLPLHAPWRGSRLATSLLETPGGDSFSLDLFDSSLSTAHHGLVVADTGSGKSVTLGALTIDALASGVDAILVDSGGSWKPLTELFGGTHITVDLKTSIAPFPSYAAIAAPGGGLEPEAIEDVVRFLEVCVTDRGQAGFDKVEADLVSRSVTSCYDAVFKTRPSEKPLIGAFRDALRAYVPRHADDRAIADRIARRLDLYCDGVYADLLNRPSKLDLSARLLTFDVGPVARNPATKAIAMATIIQAISARARSRRRRTLVEVDEGHEHLGQDDVGERFLASAYRTMRKFDVAVWMISQRFSDFLRAKAGPAIVGNSALKIFLRHGGGHDEVIEHFKLSRRASDAFRNLAMRPGHYSDFLLMYGPRTTTVRLRLHPLAYWVLTTDPADRRLIDDAAARNPRLSRLDLLDALGKRYPHGARGQRSAA